MTRIQDSWIEQLQAACPSRSTQVTIVFWDGPSYMTATHRLKCEASCAQAITTIERVGLSYDDFDFTVREPSNETA